MTFPNSSSVVHRRQRDVHVARLLLLPGPNKVGVAVKIDAVWPGSAPDQGRSLWACGRRPRSGEPRRRSPGQSERLAPRPSLRRSPAMTCRWRQDPWPVETRETRPPARCGRGREAELTDGRHLFAAGVRLVAADPECPAGRRRLSCPHPSGRAQQRQGRDEYENQLGVEAGRPRVPTQASCRSRRPSAPARDPHCS